MENGTIKGVKVKESKYVDDAKYPTQDIYSDNVVLAVGRKGANWLVDMANKHGIETETGIYRTAKSKALKGCTGRSPVDY